MKGLALFAVLVYIAFATNGTAHADVTLDQNATLVCKWLNIDNSPHGFKVMIEDMGKNGLTEDQIGTSIDYAMQAICPWYADELQAAIDYYDSPSDQRKHAV